MDSLESLREWRALARGDGAGLASRLQSDPWPDDLLQLIGEGLLVAIRNGVGGSTGLGRELVDRLRGRDWSGDEELAVTIESALGGGSEVLLQPLAVDLEELAEVLEGDPAQGGGRIDLSTGEVWPEIALDYTDEFDDEDADGEEERWLWVDCEGSRPGYRDMERFIGRIEDPEIADRLSIAISGKGAFRRFKDTLSRWPELMTRWHGFSEDRKRGRARSWLAAQGYTPVPR